MSSFLNEYQIILICSRHMPVEILKEFHRISVGEIIICSHKQGSVVSDLLCL